MAVELRAQSLKLLRRQAVAKAARALLLKSLTQLRTRLLLQVLATLAQRLLVRALPRLLAGTLASRRRARALAARAPAARRGVA